MLNAPFRVVLDANVLYPFFLRDTLLRATAAGLFQAFWSDQILSEATDNLVSDGVMNESKAAALRNAMARAFPESRVTEYEALISSMANDEKDRHVAAVAVKAGAQVIVTCNLDDFEPRPAGIEAQHPDEFLCDPFDLDRAALTELVVAQSRALKNPPVDIEGVLGALGKVVPGFAALVRQRLVTTGAPQ